MSVTIMYDVLGMTCGRCIHAVREHLSTIPGVMGVAVDLHPERASVVHVTSETPLRPAAVIAAIDAAGYVIPAA